MLLSSSKGQTLTLTETISISNRTIDASACLNADGLPGVKISGNESVQVFPASGTVTQVGLAIADGNAGNGSGGGVDCSAGGSLTMTNRTVSGCHATTNSGGVCCNNSSMTMINGKNEANYGGGVFNVGSLSVVGGTFSGNAALGGGLYNGSLGNSETSTPGTVVFSRYFRKSEGKYPSCDFPRTQSPATTGTEPTW